MATGVEELLDMLFEMIDEAKSMPLSSDKCILERDKALDLLDEIRAQFPMELAEAKKLIAARTEYIASAKREGELIRKQAEEKARQMVSEDELLAQTKQKANELMRTAEERSRDLRKAANDYCEDALRRTEEKLIAAYPAYTPKVAEDVTFITSQELEDLYPTLTPKERENAIVKENGTTFLMKIGAPLKSGKPHDGRAPDYDDWDLNGDLLFWNEPLQCSYELSSMGIRVSPESMDRQLTAAGCDDRRKLPFHKAVLNGELPYTIGGGIGQSRLCMLLLGSAHIGEVQASVWDNATREACEKAGIPLL